MSLSLSESSDIALWAKIGISLGIGGLLGLGGGLAGLVLGNLRLPLVLFLVDSAPVAAGTNIAISALSAVGGSWRHWREGRIQWRVFLVMGPSSFAGAFAGGFFSHSIPAYALLTLISIVVGISGVTTLLQARGAGSEAMEDPSSTRATPALLALSPRRMAWELGIGLTIGILSGLVGLLLGSLRLPAMLRILRMDPRLAVGTNMAVGLFTGLFGLAGHLISGSVDWLVLLLIGSSSAVGSYYGASLTGRLSQATLLRSLGMVLLVAAGAMFWQALLEW